MATPEDITKELNKLSLDDKKPAEAKNKPSGAASQYIGSGLMRPGDLKIGGLDMDGNEIKSKGDLGRARAALQAAQKALREGGGAKGGKAPEKDGKAVPSKGKDQPAVVPVLAVSSPATNLSLPSISPNASESPAAPEASKPRPRKVRSSKQTRFVLREQLNKGAPLFSHLEQGRADLPNLVAFLHDGANSVSDESGVPCAVLSKAFLDLGFQYATGLVSGTRNRCLSFLRAFRGFLREYKHDSTMELGRDMQRQFKQNCKYLDDARALPLALETMIGKCSELLGENCRKFEILKDIVEVVDRETVEWLDMLEAAGHTIAQHGNTRIDNGDVIMVYAYSETVKEVMLAAWAAEKVFKVIVIDARPHQEGRKMLAALCDVGIPCQYALLSSVNSVIRHASKVLVGASAVMSNGAVLSRVGTSVVAAAASYSHKPFIVCSETMKFTKKVQLDSLAYNELGSPLAMLAKDTSSPLQVQMYNDDLFTAPSTQNNLTSETVYHASEHLRCSNVLYDLTPSSQIKAILTELGMIPATSAATIANDGHKKTKTHVK